jgi:predicted nucleotidyltransferase
MFATKFARSDAHAVILAELERIEWEQLRGILNSYFASKAGLYHYLSMAKGNYRQYLKGSEVKLKKYLYVLRPLLACRWIIEHKSSPPMLFSELVSAEMEPEMQPAVERLLAWKMSASESTHTPRVAELNDWIETCIPAIEKEAQLAKAPAKTPWEPLNQLFLKLVGD